MRTKLRERFARSNTLFDITGSRNASRYIRQELVITPAPPAPPLLEGSHRKKK